MKKEQKIKICLLITQGEIGGAQIYVRDLATHLNRDKFDITIAHGEKSNEWLSSEAKKHSIKFKYLSFIKRSINPIYEILGFFQLYYFFITNDFSIVHLNSSKIGFLGSVAAKCAGIKKIIFTCHGWAFDDPRPGWEKKLYIISYKLMSYFVNTIITVSEYAKTAGIKRGLPQQKIVTIHNAPDLEKIDLLTEGKAREKLKNKYKVVINKKLIGTIANFYPTKGITYLLEAANIIIKDNSEYVFCIIGNGQQKSAIQKYIKEHKLNDNIFIISNLNNAATILPAFDLYVLPSVKECLPYALFEAINCGLPIVATNVGGVAEVLNYYDINYYKLVQAQDPQQLADGILKMIDKGKLNFDNLSTILGKISINKMIDSTINVYLN